MDDESIQAIVAEIELLLTSRAPGKIFQLGQLSFAIDFGLRDHRYLLISVEPELPRLYLAKRRLRDLEKQNTAPTPFGLTLRKELAGMGLRLIEKDSGDRVVRLHFEGKSDFGEAKERTLIAQLTGRSSNLFLLDERGGIIYQTRASRTPGQQGGEEYRPPHSGKRRSTASDELLRIIQRNQYDSPSEAADAHFSALISRQSLDAKVSSAGGELRKKIARQRNLLRELQTDLKTHANAEAQKRLGDLLLANISTARRNRNRVTLIDYFSPDQSTIEVEVDEKLSLSQEAEKRFASYSRSKRAVRQIQSRIAAAQKDLDGLDARNEVLDKLVADENVSALEEFLSSSGSAASAILPTRLGGHKRKQKIPGTRRYVSSDGLEILIGRAARDNDTLTFKVARPNDLWLHAADYGGSHVVVRNPTRKEIPHRTLIEAAQLAAKFSQARKDPKVDVHYTERKFVSKVKGAAPGLVRLTRFKNVTVQPQESIKRV